MIVICILLYCSNNPYHFHPRLCNILLIAFIPRSLAFFNTRFKTSHLPTFLSNYLQLQLYSAYKSLSTLYLYCSISIEDRSLREIGSETQLQRHRLGHIDDDVDVTLAVTVSAPPAAAASGPDDAIARQRPQHTRPRTHRHNSLRVRRSRSRCWCWYCCHAGCGG